MAFNRVLGLILTWSTPASIRCQWKEAPGSGAVASGLEWQVARKMA